jgi:hypothetical protein
MRIIRKVMEYISIKMEVVMTGIVKLLFRSWKNSKREGKGLMIYSNGDVYEGSWQADLKHGYGILEKKNQDKYHGYWNNGLKEGQGYYYYSSTGKIYLGEWHEDVPRCGIFTDVDDETLKKEYKKHFLAEDPVSMIPQLRLKNPHNVLEESIGNIHFLRNVKATKNKNVNELFSSEFISDLTLIFTSNQNHMDNDIGNKLPDNIIGVTEFKTICHENLGITVSGNYKINIDETIELIFYVFGISNENVKVDFMLFCRLFYLVYAKYCVQEDEFLTENDLSNLNELSQEEKDKNVLIFTAEDGAYEEEGDEDLEDEY